uniref:Zn(2)-C6 fungal-type domain-containing protein n=1 Tax=Mycena chlorophos TaxID=658473 RepID=A0ABQ0L969_MYCCL|nr:predicted protein [Mycena chlorophos]
MSASAYPTQRPASQIRLPSYKELAALALSECDVDGAPRSAGPGGNNNPNSTLFTKGLIHLPPLKVPTRPGTADSKDSAGGSRADRFLDLARHCPAAPQQENKEWPSPYSAHRPSPASSLPSLSSSPSVSLSPPRHSPPLMTPTSTSSPYPHSHLPLDSHQHHHSHSLSSMPPPQQRSMQLPMPMDIDSSRNNNLKFSHNHSSAKVPGSGILGPGVGIGGMGGGMISSIGPGLGSGRAKKQALSCYFCRERKIACGRPEEGSLDGRCNQCARRKIACTYPTVSHRAVAWQLRAPNPNSKQQLPFAAVDIVRRGALARTAALPILVVPIQQHPALASASRVPRAVLIVVMGAALTPRLSAKAGNGANFRYEFALCGPEDNVALRATRTRTRIARNGKAGRRRSGQRQTEGWTGPTRGANATSAGGRAYGLAKSEPVRSCLSRSVGVAGRACLELSRSCSGDAMRGFFALPFFHPPPCAASLRFFACLCFPRPRELCYEQRDLKFPRGGDGALIVGWCGGGKLRNVEAGNVAIGCIGVGGVCFAFCVLTEAVFGRGSLLRW